MQEIPTLLFFWPGQFVYLGQAMDTHIHSHHAVQLIISLTTPFQMRRPGEAWGMHCALLIDSDQPHECRGLGSQILFLNIEPETTVGRHLKHTFLTQQTVAELPQTLVEGFVNQLVENLTIDSKHDLLREIIVTFLAALPGDQPPQPVDERIQKALHLIQQSGDQTLKLHQLADEVCLSSGRLVHLFKEQVGIPIRKYMLWGRILNAVRYMTAGHNMTTAAHEAGFADSAHFSRTFSRMFGMMPSSMAKNSQFVQVRVWA
jgi:AraC-like DNA-binding protein